MLITNGSMVFVVEGSQKDRFGKVHQISIEDGTAVVAVEVDLFSPAHGGVDRHLFEPHQLQARQYCEQATLAWLELDLPMSHTGMQA